MFSPFNFAVHRCYGESIRAMGNTQCLLAVAVAHTRHTWTGVRDTSLSSKLKEYVHTEYDGQAIRKRTVCNDEVQEPRGIGEIQSEERRSRTSVATGVQDVASKKATQWS